MHERSLKKEPTGVNSTEEDAASLDFTSATDPFALFVNWFAQASAHEVNDPNAMALATADADGMPNVRMVLLKGLDAADAVERGFVFYTNRNSAKGRELSANPQAALLFHWKSLRRQVRARGSITPVSAAEADAYFQTRPLMSRIGAWASDQSQSLASRAVLEKSVGDYSEKYAEGLIPRPPYWSGFRLAPLEIEFWHDRPFRLHDRLVFRRSEPAAAWTTARLYP